MKGYLKLDEIAEPIFGLSKIVARRKASNGLLPVPAFRLGSAKRGPFFIREGDLERHIDGAVAKAEQLHRQMAVAR